MTPREKPQRAIARIIVISILEERLSTDKLYFTRWQIDVSMELTYSESGNNNQDQLQTVHLLPA